MSQEQAKEVTRKIREDIAFNNQIKVKLDLLSIVKEGVKINHRELI